MDEKQIQLMILKRDLQSAIQAIDQILSVPAVIPVRRGRPPKTAAKVSDEKPGRSEESRKKQAERMRLYWQAKKASAKKGK